jgi:hypothetical protein
MSLALLLVRLSAVFLCLLCHSAGQVRSVPGLSFGGILSSVLIKEEANQAPSGRM